MLVTIQFLDDFESILRGTKFNLDPEYNDTVENLKVLISLKYSELDITRITLKQGKRRLKNSEALNCLGIKEGALIEVVKKRQACCNIF